MSRFKTFSVLTLGALVAAEAFALPTSVSAAPTLKLAPPVVTSDIATVDYRRTRSRTRMQSRHFNSQRSKLSGNASGLGSGPRGGSPNGN